jgi:hypothetical protein
MITSTPQPQTYEQALAYYIELDRLKRPTIQRLKLHTAQAQIVAESKRFNVAACGRRIGKTILAIDLLKETALTGNPAAYFAPTYKMLTETWGQLVETVKPITKAHGKSEQEKRIDLTTGGIIECWSLDTDMVARSRKYKRAVVDEAAHVSGLKRAWQAAIRPTLTDLKGDGWFFSTPNGMNDFWQFFSLGLDPLKPDWACWQMPTSVNPYIDPDEIEAARRELPEDIFNQEYLAQFIADSGAVFRHILDAATAQKQLSLQPRHEYIIGCDWAKYQDFSVFAVIDGWTKELVHLSRFNRLEYQFQIDRLLALSEMFCPIMVVSEESGNTALSEQLRRLEYYDRRQGHRVSLPVRDFKTTNTSKAEIIQALALAFERQDIRVLNDPVLISELQAFRYERSDAGNLKYSAPEGMHDDCVMALALAWGEAKRYVVERTVGDRVDQHMSAYGWTPDRIVAERDDPMAWFSRELHAARLRNRVGIENKYGIGVWDALEEQAERGVMPAGRLETLW